MDWISKMPTVNKCMILDLLELEKQIVHSAYASVVHYREKSNRWDSERSEF